LGLCVAFPAAPTFRASMAAVHSRGSKVRCFAAAALGALLHLQAREWPAQAQKLAFAGGWRSRTARGHGLRRGASSGSWLEVTNTPTVEASEGASVMPVFPAPAILWPESTVEFCVVEPAHRRLYQDLLATGARQVVAPFARMFLADGSCLMHDTAPVLHLTELKDMTERTNGAMKYLARHSVVGRASIKRLLNPSALFETDATQQRVNYLRAETEVLQDTGRETGSPELAQYWGDLAAVAQRIDEPRMSNVSVKEVSAASHWQLAALWYKLRVAVHAHRSEAQVADAVNSWIQKEQEQGRMHKAAGDALETLPQPLLNQIKRLKGPLGPQLDMRFYEPFLTLLGTNDAQSRKQLMESMALEELKLTRTRASLKAMFH